MLTHNVLAADKKKFLKIQKIFVGYCKRKKLNSDEEQLQNRHCYLLYLVLGAVFNSLNDTTAAERN